MDKKSINKQIRGISNRGSLLIIVFFAFVYLAGGFFKLMYRVSEYGSVWQDDRFLTLFSQGSLFLIVYPVLFLLYFKLLNKKNGLRFKTIFRKSERSKGWLFKWTVITVGASNVIGMPVSKLLAMLLPERETLNSSAYSVVQGNDIFGWLVTIIPAVFLAPIFEELLFRGTIFRNNEPMGQLFAAFATGILFGLWHRTIEQVIGAAIAGVFLCLVFSKTRSIYTVMLIHFVNNLISLSGTYLRIQLGSILSAGDKVFMVQAMFNKQPVLSALLLALALVVLALFIAGPILLIVQIVKKRKNLGLSKGEFPYGGWKKTLIFFSAPLTIIVFVGLILFTFVF